MNENMNSGERLGIDMDIIGDITKKIFEKRKNATRDSIFNMIDEGTGGEVTKFKQMLAKNGCTDEEATKILEIAMSATFRRIGELKKPKEFKPYNCEFNELSGKTLTDVTAKNAYEDEIIFTCDDGSKYKMYCIGMKISLIRIA